MFLESEVVMKNKVCFIICYFGAFPNYFHLFLKSCQHNKDFNWLIFTDNKQKYDYPNNVKVIEIDFVNLVKFIKEKLSFDVSLNAPYKLCDYRGLYGEIFGDYLRGYSHWGHCDVDVIFGDLSLFITDELLDRYDRLFTFGHMSIYKNESRVNGIYKLSYSGISYKRILSNSKHFGFDEFRGMNQICKENNISWYRKNVCADINRNEYLFYPMNKIDEEDKIFWHKNGHLYCQSRKNHNELADVEEYAYIHLQKRKMEIEDGLSEETYYIVPNKFTNNKNISANMGGQLQYKIHRYINDFIAKVKWNVHWRIELIRRKIELMV